MTTRTCIVCQNVKLEPTELQTCIRCLGHTRSVLVEIVDLYALLPAEIAEHVGASSPPDVTAIRSQDRPMPGGDALVLLAGGSKGASQVRAIWEWSEPAKPGRRKIDPAYAEDEHSGDTPSVVGELGSWEDDFRATAGVPASSEPASVAGASRVLLRNLTWAAQHHPAFDEFAVAMRQLLDVLRHVNRDGDPVERGVACPYCDRRIVRRFVKADPCDHKAPQRRYKADCAGQRCDHASDHPEHWRGGVEPYEGWARRIDAVWAEHAKCDQGGKREDWVCSNRDCDGDTPRVFSEREYNFAVWTAWYKQHEPDEDRVTT